MSEVLFKRGKLANLPVETDPNTFYLIEDIKTIQIGGAVIQDTNDVKVELKGIINDKYAATTQKITELEEQMVHTSALTRVEEMIPVSTSQLTNDSGFLTEKDIPSDLTAYVTEEKLVQKGYATTSYVDEQMSSKQDVISDLEDIRDGASKGSTALQPNDVATVATSGSYNDLLNKPIIPEAITESDVSDWGFTKNTGTYSKPTDGIPKTDLSYEVLVLLNKANTALQSIPSEYVTEEELVSKGYITEHQDLSGKQDVISDLDTIRANAALAATALQSVPSEYITESELNAKSYLTSIPSEYITESELTAKNYLTSVPSEYVTESELNDKGYLTETELNDKGYLTEVPSEYITESELNNKNYVIKTELDNFVLIDEFISLAEVVDGKVDANVLSGYSTTSHTHDDKQDVITDLDTIRANATLGATALQSIPSEYITESELNAKGYLTSIPSEYVTETELNNKGYATTSSVNSQINTINQTIGVNTAGFTLADRITKLEDGYDAPDARANVLWIGTSIPAGDISFSNNGTTQSITTDLGSNNYPKMIADVLGFNLYNNSRGSSFVCFYPSNEDGTANWAGKDWSEYSSEVWKGYSLSASFAQVDEKFGPNGLNCPEWLVNNFKSYSYESLIIPYIDGTLASCDTVVIDHGYNDRSIIINEASWHPGEGETQFAVGAGRDWLLKLQDPFETTLEAETYFQGKWWNDESVSSKKHYISAIIFLVKKIWAVNPKIKIIIGNYFTSKSNVFGAEFGNDRLGEFVHLANSAIASWLRVNCVEVWHHTGLYNRNVGGVNDYQNFCPDGVHPHSDSTGHSNKVIAGVYINALRGTLYK